MVILPVISPEDAEELRHLNDELLSAHQRVAGALRTNGEPLEGAALQKLIEEEAKVVVIVRRIKEILGISGQSWNA